MAQDLFGKDKQPETPPAENAANEALSKINETLSSLSETVTGFGSKISELEAKINAPADEETTTEEWRPKTWGEIPEKAEEIATSVVERKLNEKEKAAQQEKALEDEKVRRMDAYLDQQMADLEKSGFLPKIANPNDENDPGRRGRAELLGFSARVGTLSLEKAAEVLGKLHEAGYSYDARANNMTGEYLKNRNQPEGMFAPVSSSSRSSGQPTGKPDYKQLHNMSMDQLIKSVIPDY